MRVYLAGPINGCSDSECKDWRANATHALGADNVFDPMVRDYRGREGEPGIAAKIVEQDKADINASSAVLVYFDRPSVGTSMEVLYAWEQRKPVFVVNASGKALSPWLAYHASGGAFSDPYDAAESILAHHEGTEPDEDAEGYEIDQPSEYDDWVQDDYCRFCMCFGRGCTCRED